LGVQEVTRKGMKEKDMDTISDFFYRSLKSNENNKIIHNDVIDFVSKYNKVCF